MTNRSDVVVVGAGIAGVAAALEASGRGAHVMVLDSAAAAGGTASISAGGTCVAGSSLQRNLGIADSPDRALTDWLISGGPTVDLEWAQRYLEASAPEVFDYLSAVGVMWSNVEPKEGNSVPRWHKPRGGGAEVMRLLVERARTSPSISWRFDTRVTALTLSGGCVTGVIAHGPSVQTEHLAGSVVLACGGFNNDAELVRQFAAPARQGKRVLLAGGPSARGDGHRMLQDVGADLVDMDAIWMYPFTTVDDESPRGERGLVLRDLDGDVWINATGVRFHDEALRGGGSGALALLAQPDASGWSILDARIAARMTVSHPSYRKNHEPARDQIARLLRESPHIASANTWVALADQIGVDRQQLKTTIGEHNLARRLKRPIDPDFGRPLAGLPPLQDPPFYAIQLFLSARKNLGGVRTDRDCRVLTTSGRAIDGLFAAGEVAGMAGGHINGRGALEGTMFGPSLYSGRVAGRAV